MFSKNKVKAPVAKLKPNKSSIHGEERVDNYYWLRDKENPEVIEYLKSENEYTEAMMKHTEEFQKQLFEEMKERIKEDDISAPEKAGDYHYYFRMEKEKQYKKYFRKKLTDDTHEEPLLDVNELAKGHGYFKIGAFKVSPNHELLAYSVDTKGSEEFTIYIKNLVTGVILENRIKNAYYDLEWANDSQTFLYTVLDNSKRPFKLYYHKIETDPSNDQLIYHEKDDAYFLYLSKTRDQLYFVMSLKSNITSEIHYLKANNPEGNFSIVHPRQHKMEYYIDHLHRKFVIRTNDRAKNFKLMTSPVENPSKENWKEWIPHRDSVLLRNFEVFENHLVLHEREEGLTKIRIIDLQTNEEHNVDFLEPVYTCEQPLEPTITPEFKSEVLRFNYTSLVTPKSVFDHNMNIRKKKLIKQEEILGDYNPEKYQTKRISAKTADEKSVYISLVHKKEIEKDGTNPLLLYGYGSYGYSIDPQFLSYRISLLDRGFIFAIAHIRGGSELGRKWYDKGKLLHKKNTFTDFIACAEHLIAEKYTSSEKLCIMGGSAGGLLMGAVTNMRPDLFKTVVTLVPFVDVINTMLDPKIPLTVIEYEEWGNPIEREFYDYMKSYSPYDNLERKNYPNMLITAGLNDPRVQYWEPAKLTAKLRSLKTDSNRLLLKTHMGEGHHGKSGRYDAIKETALYYAFILDSVGIKE